MPATSTAQSSFVTLSKGRLLRSADLPYDCPEFGRGELLRLECFARSFHNSLHYQINGHERRLGLCLDLDLPFTAVGTFQSVAVARAVNRVPVVVRKTRRNYGRAGFHTSLSNRREEMNRLHILGADLLGDLLQETFGSLDHVV